VKRCILTGATGLIGRNLLPLLEEGDWSTHAVVRKKSREDTDCLRFITCDLSREFSTSPFPAEADAVVHLAQSEHFREFPLLSDNIFGVNTLSTVRLLDYARKAKAKSFVYASSGGIYGHGIEGFKEDEPIVTRGDLGFYLSTKLCSEVLADSYSHLMNVIVLRFFFVYGPGQRQHMLIPRLIERVRRGEPILLHGQSGIKINPIFVTDAAWSIARALSLNESHTINVAGPDVLSMRAIGETIGKAVDRAPRFEIREDTPPRDLIGDTNKMAKLLRPPEVRFSDGIAKMVAEE
jgi:nucleoside-diphosphate-sugar epimerase